MQEKCLTALYILILLFAGQSAFAQKELRYSLSELKASLPKKNTKQEKIALHLRISSFYLHNKVRNTKNLDSALFFADQAYSISKADPSIDPDHQAKLGIAQVFITKKRLREVRAMLTDDSKKFRTRLLLLLGKYYLYKPGEDRKDLDSATTDLNNCVTLSRTLNDIPAEQSALLYLIDIKVEKGDLIGTRPAFIQLAKECERLNNLAGAADVYSLIGDHFLFTETKEKVKYYTYAMNLYGSANREEDRINLLKALGDVNFNAGKLDTAEKQLLTVLKWFKTHHYKNLQDTYFLLSVLNRFKGDFNHALFYALEAVKSAQYTESDEAESYYFGSLAQTYNEMGDDKKSIFWYRKTIESLHKQRSEFFYNNLKDLSNHLIKQGKSNEVLTLLKSVPVSSQPTALENEIIAAVKGNCYRAQKNNVLAEKYYLEMIKWEQLARVHTYNSSDSYRILADFYISTQSFEKAENYLKKILDMPTGTYPLSRIKDVYLDLYQIDSVKQDWSAAINHYKKYKSVNDIIFNKEKNKRLQELLVKYDADKKDADNRLLRKESLIQRNKLQKADLLSKITISGTLALLIIIVLLYNQYRNRQKANRMLHAYQKEITYKNDSLQLMNDKQGKLLVEKEWLIKEIHHRVKNNLQVVMSLLNTQANYTDNEVAVSAIRDSQNRMQSITLIHQKLFQSDQVASIDIHAYIIDLMKFLCDTFHYNQRINFDFNIPSIPFDIVQAMPLGLIINEAMTNIIKYAFPNNENGTVKIILERLDNDFIQFTIADNGTGLPADFNLENSNTLGMTLMKGLSQQIDGEIAITSSNGVSVSIKFLYQKPDHTLHPHEEND